MLHLHELELELDDIMCMYLLVLIGGRGQLVKLTRSAVTYKGRKIWTKTWQHAFVARKTAI
jgi:hypothetical protein